MRSITRPGGRSLKRSPLGCGGIAVCVMGPLGPRTPRATFQPPLEVWSSSLWNRGWPQEPPLEHDQLVPCMLARLLVGCLCRYGKSLAARECRLTGNRVARPSSSSSSSNNEAWLCGTFNVISSFFCSVGCRRFRPRGHVLTRV